MGKIRAYGIGHLPIGSIDEQHLKEDAFTYPISFNGKMRFTLELSADLSKEDIEKEVMAFEKTKQYMEGKNLKRIIIVRGKSLIS